MIHVALDTSIFRSKPRLDSPEFKALGYLVDKNCVRVHIPYIVEREFGSYLYHEHEKKIDRTINSLSGLTKHNKATSLVPELEQSLEKLKDKKEVLAEETNELFHDWLNSIDAVTYEFSGEEAKSAIDAYFYGHAPLKQPKNRNDIPDSFIYQAVKSLHATHEDQLHFVVNDGNLRDACQSAEIYVHKTLSDFINIEEAKSCLKNAVIDENIDSVAQHLVQFATENKDEVFNKIESLLLSDEYRLIFGESVPGEFNEIYVVGVEKPTSIEIFGSVDHFGEGLFVLYFSAVVELWFDFPVHRSDAYGLDSDKYHLGDLNDHYFTVETNDEFSFKGRLELEYQGDFGVITTSNELKEALTDPKISISNLEDFEIKD